MAIDPNRPASRRGSSSSALVGLLAVAAVGGGIYYATHRPERPPARNDDALAQIAALARAEKDAEWIRRAIRDGQAILGMTYEEVELAKGKPARKVRADLLSHANRAKGGVEKWIYELGGGDEAGVLFGASGLVIESSEIGDSPLPSQSVRK